jgi:hypothetical protein
MTDNTQFTIKYEGGLADQHKMELDSLGLSLQGFAKILAICHHYSITGLYNKSYARLDCKIYASETKAGSFEVKTILDTVAQKELWSGFAGALFSPIINYVFSKKGNDEMKLLKDALDTSMAQLGYAVEKQHETTQHALVIIEKMATALQPSVQQAMTPVGQFCDEITLTNNQQALIRIDQSLKDKQPPLKLENILPATRYLGTISELDLSNQTCKITLKNETTRIQGQISDPLCLIPNNPYALALASCQIIQFTAKATTDEDGEITKLFITDCHV